MTEFIKPGQLAFIPERNTNCSLSEVFHVPQALAQYLLPGTVWKCWEGPEGISLYQELPANNPASHQVFRLKKETAFTFPCLVNTLLIFGLGDTLPLLIGKAEFQIVHQDFQLFKSGQLSNESIIVPAGAYEIVSIDMKDLDISTPTTTQEEVLAFVRKGSSIVRSVLNHFQNAL